MTFEPGDSPSHLSVRVLRRVHPWGAIQGRKTFSIMLTYIRMAASANFGNVFSIVFASVFLLVLPMAPLAGHFASQPLPRTFFVWMVRILFDCALLTTLMKRVFIRRFGWQ